MLIIETSKQNLDASQLTNQINFKLRPFVVEALEIEIAASAQSISKGEVIAILTKQMRDTQVLDKIIQQSVEDSDKAKLIDQQVVLQNVIGNINYYFQIEFLTAHMHCNAYLLQLNWDVLCYLQ